jgi:hypothetical protein
VGGQVSQGRRFASGQETAIHMNRLILQIVMLLIGLLLFGCISKSAIVEKNCKIKIQWIVDLQGDFDFRTKWSYPEGVYRNEFGQLSCDGLCPQETESMKDSTGKIYTDSLSRFYQVVDTTHQYHSIECEARGYEWSGTDFITATQTNQNHLMCFTQATAGTHSSLILEIIDDLCLPRIDVKSISTPGEKSYFCKSGCIKIDKDLMNKGILKAEFQFDFNNSDEPDRNMFWKGKIYTAIAKQ